MDSCEKFQTYFESLANFYCSVLLVYVLNNVALENINNLNGYLFY